MKIGDRVIINNLFPNRAVRGKIGTISQLEMRAPYDYKVTMDDPSCIMNLAGISWVAVYKKEVTPILNPNEIVKNLL